MSFFTFVNYTCKISYLSTLNINIMKITKHLLFLLLVSVMAIPGHTQTVDRWVIGSMGGSYESGDWVMDYTLGESVITTLSTPGSVLTQGFHQPGSLTVSVNEHPENDFQVLVYPNPSTDVLNISISNNPGEKTVIELYDLVGQRLEAQEFSNSAGQPLTCTFTMQRYATGAYFLRITSGKTVSEVIKITKISQ